MKTGKEGRERDITIRAMLVVSEFNAVKARRGIGNHNRIVETRIERSGGEKNVKGLSASNIAFLRSMGFVVPKIAR